jgi:hypothetical protein
MGRIGDSPNIGVHALNTPNGLRWRAYAGQGGGGGNSPAARHYSTGDLTSTEARDLVDDAQTTGTWASTSALLENYSGGSDLVSALPTDWRTLFVAGLALVDDLP